MKTQKTYIAMAGAVIISLAACTTDEIGNLFRSNDERISFTVTTDEQGTRALADDNEPALSFEGTQAGRPLTLTTTIGNGRSSEPTRGTRLTNVSNLTTFGVSAILTPSPVTASDLNAATPNFFYKLPATKNANNVFQISKDYYWPASNQALTFYAYAPYDDDAHAVLSADDAPGPQKVQFTVDGTVTSQVELLTAKTTTTAFTSATGDTKTAAVPLQFCHELTAIRFVIGEQWLAGSIKSVAIKNVHGKGTLTIGSHEWKWKTLANDTCKATDSFALTIDKTELNGTKDEAVMTGDFANHYFLMIPQEFDANSEAYLEVVYQDDAKDYTVTCPLAGKTWTRNTTVTYAIASHELTKLRIGTISWPDESAADSWSGPKTAFASGDSIGLYVVGTNGTTIEHQNVKCTYNGSSWTIHHPEGDPVYKLPGRQYFFYYPYTPTPDTSYPLQGQGSTNTAATDFFTHLIDGWTPAAVQDDQTGELFLKQDLQVGKGTDHAQQAPAVDVQMAHQMNIGIITLGSGSVDLFYKLDDSYQWKHGTTTSTASASIGTGTGNQNQPYKPQGDTKYYYVFAPVENTTQSGPALIGYNNKGTADWSTNLKTTSRGIRLEKVPTPSTAVVQNYPSGLTVGDIYYSNGAVSHSLTATSTNANYGTPIGIVGYVGQDAFTEYNTVSGKGGHGLVMCLRDAAVSSTNSPVMWKIEDTSDGRTHVTAYAEWLTTAVSGYTETHALNDVNHPAFQYAVNYTGLSAPADKSTGWFLGSIGQWRKILDNFTGATLGMVDARLRPLSTYTTKVNDKLKVAGSNAYDAFDATSNGIAWYWTANSISDVSAWDINLYNETREEQYRGLWVTADRKSSTATWTKVRPFLAF